MGKTVKILISTLLVIVLIGGVSCLIFWRGQNTANQMQTPSEDISNVPEGRIDNEAEGILLHLNGKVFVPAGEISGKKITVDTLRGYCIYDGRQYDYFYSFNEFDPDTVLVRMHDPGHKPEASEFDSVEVWKNVDVENMSKWLEDALKE